MKSIATINFKGGVGKTTITWLLAKYAAEVKHKKVLVIDTDAQMSLTLAVQLQESGAMYPEYEKWEQQHRAKKKTLLNALEKYDSAHGGHFDFPISADVIYQMSPNLHFIPSTEELYWLEMEVFDKLKVKDFARALLGKIEHSKTYSYDYVFFDCPPNFTALSFSVLGCASLILIPINPDVFASRGIGLMVDGLRMRIEPWPNPKVGVFMNKAKLYSGSLTRETSGYWREAKKVCEIKQQEGMKIIPFEAYVPDRVSIKRAIPGKYFPDEFASNFAALWDNVEKTLR
jgi:chromosome partitioning protein